MRPKRLYLDKDKDEFFYMIGGKKRKIKRDKKMSQKQIQKVNIVNVIGELQGKRLKPKRRAKRVYFSKKIVEEQKPVPKTGIDAFYTPSRYVPSLGDIQSNIKNTKDDDPNKLKKDILELLKGKPVLPAVPAPSAPPLSLQRPPLKSELDTLMKKEKELEAREKEIERKLKEKTKLSASEKQELLNEQKRLQKELQQRIDEIDAIKKEFLEQKEKAQAPKETAPRAFTKETMILEIKRWLKNKISPVENTWTEEQVIRVLKEPDWNTYITSRKKGYKQDVFNKALQEIINKIRTRAVGEELGAVNRRATEILSAPSTPYVEPTYDEETGWKGFGMDGDTGMYNDEITDFLQKETNMYVPVIATDELNKLFQHIKPNMKKFAFVINTVPSQADGTGTDGYPSGHWRTVFIDNRDDYPSIEWFDPLGGPPEKSIVKALKKMATTINPERLFLFKQNMMKRQNDVSSNCGQFCIKFIDDRNRGVPFSKATGYDDYMKEKGPVDDSSDGEQDIEEYKNQKFNRYI